MLKPTTAILAAALSAAPTIAQAPPAKSDARDFPLSLPAVPTGDPEFADPTNAALLYYRAFLLLNDDLNKKIADSMTSQAPNWTPDADTSKQLSDSQGAVYTLLRAAKIDSADFGVEYSQGIGALLPHLSKMRAASRLLAADSRREVAENHADDAADRVAAVFSLARHCTHDRLLISALVSVAIDAQACSQADYLMTNSQLTEAGKQKILAAMDRFRSADPFGIKSAIKGERYWCVVWIRAQCAAPGGADLFAKQILPLLEDNPDSPDIKTIREMDLKAINADLDKADGFYTAAIDAFDHPDGLDRLGALEKKAAAGEYGIIAKHVVPAMGKCFTSNSKALARQSETRARLANFIARPN